VRPLRESKKLCFVDLETSGLEPGPAVILSVGAITDSGQEYSALITPTDIEWVRATPRALEVNGLTLSILQTKGKSRSKVAVELATWLSAQGIVGSKGVFVGQNPKFDMRFFEHFFADEFAFFDITREPAIDVRDMYTKAINAGLVTSAGAYRDGRTISLSLGLPPEPEPHDALEGARAVKRHYEALTKLLSERKMLVR
jgi:DNA polymerase III epsilon subunit-like protein